MHARIAQLERYVRRDTTLLARALRLLSPRTGRDYARSRTKRALDFLIGVPVFLLSFPPMALLVALTKILHPRLPVFFVQDRVGRSGPVRVVKIRSMAPGRWRPAVTRLGLVLRRHKLDELPQIVSVLEGTLSLVGIRVLPVEICEDLQRAWSPERFAVWRDAYGSARLGLTGIHQVMRGVEKEDRRRFHRDVFYIRHANLGLDLYLLWRTVLRMLEPPRS